MRYLSLSIGMLLFASIVVAQKNKKGTAVVDRYNPTFKFEPEKRDKVASSNITIALLKPTFIDKDIATAGEPWENFSTSMQSDIEELLTAKGFKVRGPYNSRDEMVFNDKKNSDFTLEISINLRLNIDRTYKQVFELFGSSTLYKVTQGRVSISPEVIMTAVSNFSGEKLWKKRLTLAQSNFTYVGTIKWDGYPTALRELQLENNLYNPFAKALEDIYKSGLTILWNQFDKDEMKMIAEEAQKERTSNSQTKP